MDTYKEKGYNFWNYGDSVGISFDETVENNIDKIGMLSKKSINILNNNLTEKNIAYLPSSVNTDAINISENSLITKNIRIIFMGGYHPIRKGLKDIVSMAPSIIEHNSNIKFFFSGSQTVKGMTNSLIKKYPTNFSFIGWIPEDSKFSLLKSMDIFILPSYNEGLPYAIVEAMACGLVILAYDVGGISEIIKEGHNGFITPIGDKTSFKKNLINISNNRKKVKEISINNFEKAETELSLNTVLNKIDKIYFNLYE